jgi:hypothetical protein
MGGRYSFRFSLARADGVLYGPDRVNYSTLLLKIGEASWISVFFIGTRSATILERKGVT